MKFKVPLFRMGWLQASCSLHEACNHPIRKSDTLNFIPTNNIDVPPPKWSFSTAATFWEAYSRTFQTYLRKTIKKSMFSYGFQQSSSEDQKIFFPRCGAHGEHSPGTISDYFIPKDKGLATNIGSRVAAIRRESRFDRATVSQRLFVASTSGGLRYLEQLSLLRVSRTKAITTRGCFFGT